MFDVMSPITHFFAGWLVANLDDLNRRDRLLVTLAGIVPDLDGLGIVPDFLTRHSAQPLNWWSDYHHLFGHNLLFGLAAASLGFAVATKRPLASLLILLTFPCSTPFGARESAACTNAILTCSSTAA